MGSIILFKALAEGAIDCYIDYSGTIWTNVMKRENMPPRSDMLGQLTEWLNKEHDITCLGALGFENTYALAVRKETALKYKLKTISDLAEVSSGFSMGSDYEFFSRPEWEELNSKYNLNFKKLISLDPSLMYRAIEQNEVDVISAYSTDGRIVDYDLQILEDPLQALPPYDAILLLSKRASENRELVEELSKLIGIIDNESMRQANKLVDVDGLPVERAADFLNTKINIKKY